MVGVNGFWIDKTTTLLPQYKSLKKGEQCDALQVEIPANDDDDSVDGETRQEWHNRVHGEDNELPVVDAAELDEELSVASDEEEDGFGEPVYDEEIADGGARAPGDDDDDDGDADAAVIELQNAALRAARAARDASVAVPPVGLVVAAKASDLAFNCGAVGQGNNAFVGQRVMLLQSPAVGSSRATRTSAKPAVWREARVARVANAADQSKCGNTDVNYVMAWADEPTATKNYFPQTLLNRDFGATWVLLRAADELSAVTADDRSALLQRLNERDPHLDDE